MRLIALAPLAVAVSQAGGLGFIGAGSETSGLAEQFEEAQTFLKQCDPPLPTRDDLLPVGVGFLNWGADVEEASALVAKYRPAAVWFFAARSPDDMVKWTDRIRQACPHTKIWIQVGTVKTAVEYTQRCTPDVLVVQGTDAGGHGLQNGGSSLITLLPEVVDALAGLPEAKQMRLVAAGGIMEARGTAAAMVLGAQGVVLGTRLLGAQEANITKGYRQAVLAAGDGGVSTIRSSVYDTLRGTTDWPAGYGGRGVINRSYHDSLAGMPLEENKKLYNEAVEKGDEGWGDNGRLTTYAGAGVGLVKEVKGAGDIVEEICSTVPVILSRLADGA